jgi:acetylornithine deacetylase/succinyl-diaminopimelate desuccinylase-like protein
MPIVNRIADFHGEITAWRRDIHAHPELLYDVHRTAATVADKLRSFGCDEVVTGIGRTGVVAVIRGSKDAGSNRVIGLRADMDALPIEEANDVPYKSTVPGKMHACGHDGHTAMLLGAAKYLAETRNFDGTAVVIFQPAEEGGGGGHRADVLGAASRQARQRRLEDPSGHVPGDRGHGCPERSDGCAGRAAGRRRTPVPNPPAAGRRAGLGCDLACALASAGLDMLVWAGSTRSARRSGALAWNWR